MARSGDHQVPGRYRTGDPAIDSAIVELLGTAGIEHHDDLIFEIIVTALRNRGRPRRNRRCRGDRLAPAASICHSGSLRGRDRWTDLPRCDGGVMIEVRRLTAGAVGVEPGWGYNMTDATTGSGATTPGGDPPPPPPPPPPSAPSGPSGSTDATTQLPVPAPAPPPPPPRAPVPPPVMGPAPAAASPGSTSKLVVAVLIVVALLVGIGIGFAAAQSKVTKTQKELASMTDDRNAYKTQVDDRAAQQAADDAAVAKSRSDKQTADDAAAPADHCYNVPTFHMEAGEPLLDT